MFFEYLTQGVKAGLLAGVVFGLLMAGVANPLVTQADTMNHAAGEAGHAGETGGEHGHEAGGEHAAEAGGEHGHEAGGEHAAEAGGDHESEAGHAGEGEHTGGDNHETAVSAAVNGAVSVLAGGLWAVLLGGVFFGVVYYFLEPAIPGTGATKSYVLGLAGFVTISGAPWLVLPPVSPGAEQSLAVSTRLPLYIGMMAAGALVCLLAGYVYNRVSESEGRVLGTVAATLPFGLLAIPVLLAPTNAVEGALSPAFRTGLVGLFVFGQALLWLLLAVAHARFSGTLSGGSESGVSTTEPDATPVAD